MMGNQPTDTLGDKLKLRLVPMDILETVALALSLFFRMAFQFYGLPGFSYKGLEYPSDGEMVMIILSITFFVAGVWYIKDKGRAAFIQGVSLILLTSYDLKKLWQWGSHAVNSQSPELLFYLTHYTFPAFWVVQAIDFCLLILSIARFCLDKRRRLERADS